MKWQQKTFIFVMKHKWLLIRSFAVILHSTCLIAVLILGIHCFSKFMERIQSIDIAYDRAQAHPFPDMSFCPLEENQEGIDYRMKPYAPKPYDYQVLRDCDLDPIMYNLTGNSPIIFLLILFFSQLCFKS